MFFNQFSVKVVGGEEKSEGYVLLPHGKQYSLSLHNSREIPCDAEVSVDGKSIGVFRINAGVSMLLERPANDTGRFTFYELGTPEASSAGLAAGDPDLGLVSVRFRPGYSRYAVPSSRPRPLYPKRPYWWWDTPYRFRWCEASAATVNTTGTYTASGVPQTIQALSAATVNTTGTYTASGVPQTIQALSAGGTGLSGCSMQTFYGVEGLNYLSDQEVTINLRLVSSGKAADVRPLRSSSTPIPPPVK